MWHMQEGGRPLLDYTITVSGSLDQLISFLIHVIRHGLLTTGHGTTWDIRKSQNNRDIKKLIYINMNINKNL